MIRWAFFICNMIKSLTSILSIVTCIAASAQTEIKTFYNQGILKEEYVILNNDSSMVDGPYKMYDLKGNVIVSGQFNSGAKDGIFYNYYPDGSIQRQTIYKNDLREGLTQVFAATGKVIQESTFHNDTLVGSVRLYDEDGNLKGSTSFEDGKPDGCHFPLDK